jgi:tetratricopeptide (TPR) repeat protein
VTFASTATLACASMIVAGLSLTHAEELRRDRWWKIALSIPVVTIITAGFYNLSAISGFFSILFMGVLGFIWKSPFAHFLSLGISKIIFEGNSRTGIRADISGAKALARHGDLDEAIAHLEAELQKEPFNYEGLLLLADGYKQRGQYERARKALVNLFESPDLTPDQRIVVEHELAALKNLVVANQMNSRK